MKRILLLIILFMLHYLVKSQHLIIKTNRDTIKGKVVKVGVKDIEYLNSVGVTYVIKKSQVAEIVYNDTKETLNDYDIYYNTGNKFSFGINLGNSMANQSIKQSSSFEDARGSVSSAIFVREGLDNVNQVLKHGVNVGVFIELGLNDFLSIRPRLNYRQKGLKFKPDKLYYLVDYLDFPIGIIDSPDLRLHHISFDIPLKIMFSTKPLVPYLNFGISSSLYLGYKSNFGTTALSDGSVTDVPIISIDQMNKINFGGYGGVGMDFKFADKHYIILEIYANPDFTNAYKDDYYQIKNNVFGILLGYRVSVMD